MLQRFGRFAGRAWRRRQVLPYIARFPAAEPHFSTHPAPLPAQDVAAEQAATTEYQAAAEKLGWALSQEGELAEYGAYARLWKHRSGAELLSIRGDDHKTFGIALRTPVGDDTGVAHIMEHSVLCGSEKYPVRDPFVVLARSSMHTYLNAMTYPDRTVYPVASPNTTDFYNMVSVYCDAVYRPRLRPETLAQEGVHIVPDDDQPGALAYRGVVFNEMKGMVSNPDFRAVVAQCRLLWPDSEYSHCSGGQPVAIPNLTWPAFQAFHKQYYCPANSRIFMFGDDSELQRLETMAEALDAVPAGSAAGPPQPQRRFTEPVRATVPFPVSEAGEQGGPGKHWLSISWLLDAGKHRPVPNMPADLPSPGTDVGSDLKAAWGCEMDDETGHWVLSGEAELALAIVSHCLEGTPSSTMARALRDSGLGGAVLGHGVDSTCSQSFVEFGLREVQAADLGAVEELVMSTLQQVASDGFSQAAVDAALNSIEFRLREFSGASGTPKGLSLFLSTASAWQCGQDPVDGLRWEERLERVKARLADSAEQSAGYPSLRSLVRALLVDNTHRVVMTMEPDHELEARELQAEEQRLAAIAASLTPAELDQTAAAAAKLAAEQAAPADPAASATVPTLNLADVPRDSKRVHAELRTRALPACDVGALQDYNPGLGPGVPLRSLAAAAGDEGSKPNLSARAQEHVRSVRDGHAMPIVASAQNTNGIVYARSSFDLAGISWELLPLVPLYCYLAASTGLTASAMTGAADDAELAHRIGASTGGVGMSLSYAAPPGCRAPSEVVSRVVVAGKALHSQTDTLAALMRDILVSSDLERPDIILHTLKEMVASMEDTCITAGHRVAGTLNAALWSQEGMLAEAFSGVTHLLAMRYLRDGLVHGTGTALSTAHIPGSPALDMARYAGLSAQGVAQQLQADLHAIRDQLAVSSRAMCSIGSEEQHLDSAVNVLGGVMAEHVPVLPASGTAQQGQAWPHPPLWQAQPGDAQFDPAAWSTAIVVPTAVNYAAIGAPVTEAPGAAAPLRQRLSSPSWDLASQWLSMGYLWEHVRVQGGAYGAFAGVSGTSGVARMASYRDPELARTLDTFRAAGSALADAPPVGKDLENTIIASVGKLDAPMSPVAALGVATRRLMHDVDQSDVQWQRERLLDANTEGLVAHGEALQYLAPAGVPTAVVSEPALRGSAAKQFAHVIRPLDTRSDRS